MAAKTMRDLVAGSGTVSMTSGSYILTFSGSQSFKKGATVQAQNGQLFTIGEGSGMIWLAFQPATATASGQTFNTSDPGLGRARGTSGLLVTWAPVFLYGSVVDDAGGSDAYGYGDTLFPVGGLHPYTKDVQVSLFAAKGTWMDVTAARALGTTYQNRNRMAAVRIVSISAQGVTAGTLQMTAYCDSANPPTGRIVGRAYDPANAPAGSAHYGQLTILVPCGWYYQVAAVAGTIEKWQERDEVAP